MEKENSRRSRSQPTHIGLTPFRKPSSTLEFARCEQARDKVRACCGSTLNQKQTGNAAGRFDVGKYA